MKRITKWTIAALAIAGSVCVGYFNLDRLTPPRISQLPETITIPGGDFAYRMSGQFRTGSHIVDAPLQKITNAPRLTVMKYQVSQAEYDACVADEVCRQTVVKSGPDLPQAAVSYYDAMAYAEWFSKMTHRQWRLPSAVEWQRYAGDDYIDLALGDLDDANDPSVRWLAQYAQQTALRSTADLDLRKRGANGENNYGIADIAANVWEWTDTCYYNVQLDTDGTTVLDSFENCAVRAVEGKHTAYIIEFVRDANVGGCAAGIPPDFLGFRLILES